MYKKISLLFASFAIIASAAIAQEPVRAKKTQDPVKIEPASKPKPAPVAQPAPAPTPAPAPQVNKAPAPTVTTTTTSTPYIKRSKLNKARVKPASGTAVTAPADKVKEK